ncbi:25961_t:CDS:1, partial [Dentiscutata erythropus]
KILFEITVELVAFVEIFDKFVVSEEITVELISSIELVVKSIKLL